MKQFASRFRSTTSHHASRRFCTGSAATATAGKEYPSMNELFSKEGNSLYGGEIIIKVFYLIYFIFNKSYDEIFA